MDSAKRVRDIPVGDVSALESTLPIHARKTPSIDDGATIYAFSHDAELANALRSAARNQHKARVVNEWSDLMELVESGKCRIVLLDVDALNLSVESALGQLNASADWMVIIIAAKQQQAQSFMHLWSERRIHRLLIKPAAVGITRLLIESAVGRYVELREFCDQPGPGLDVPNRAQKPSTKPSRFASFKRLAFLVIGLFTLAAWLEQQYWLGSSVDPTPPEPEMAARVSTPATQTEAEAEASSMLASEVADRSESPNQKTLDELSDDASDSAPRGEPVAEAQAAPDAVREPQVVPRDVHAERLELASTAIANGEIVEPVGASAMDQYLLILAETPNHAVARARLDELIEQLFSTAESALLAGELDGAENILFHLRRARPTGSRLVFLEEQLSRARESAANARAAETLHRQSADSGPANESATGTGQESTAAVLRAEESAVANSELARYIALTESRLQQGFLLRPESDNARYYLERAAEIGPTSIEVLEARLRLVEALTASARQLLDSGVLETARELSAAAFDLGADQETLATLNEDLSVAFVTREREELTELGGDAQAKIENEWLVEPRDGSAYEIIARLRDRAPNFSGLPALIETYGASAEAQARAAIASMDWELAARLVASLGDLAYEERTTRALESDLSFARQQATYLETASPVSELRALKTVAPVYPRRALDDDVTGWVDLEFVVDQSGRPRNIAVVDADPVGQFEDSAVAAVQQYEFEPFVSAGRRFERRIRLRIRYSLN